MTEKENERRQQCISHEATILTLERIRGDMKLQSTLSKGIIACGMALITLSVSALIYFGSLENRVVNAERNQVRIMDRLAVLEIRYAGQHSGSYKGRE